MNKFLYHNNNIHYNNKIMKIMYRNNMMMNKVNQMRINDNLMDGPIKIKIRMKNNSKELL
jgi:hypothetical protein